VGVIVGKRLPGVTSCSFCTMIDKEGKAAEILMCKAQFKPTAMCPAQ
jgi:hypothetical protein